MPLINISLRQLRAFIAVADRGSFIAAAQALGVSQPALSQCIRQLELQIGGRLLSRTTRHVALTTLGLGLLPHARDLLRRFDSVMAEVQELAARRRGRVIVACLPSVAYRFMPQVIAAMKASRPRIGVVIRDANLKGVIDSVVAGEADLGIGSLQAHHPELDSTLLATDRFHVVCPRGHPLAARDEVAWRDLAPHPFVAMGPETGVRAVLDEVVAKHGVSLSPVSEVSHLATVNGLLEEGLGISALAGLMLPRGDHPLLTHRPLVEPVVERQIRIFWRRGGSFSAAAWAVVEVVGEILRSGPPLAEWPHVQWHPPFRDRRLPAREEVS